MIKHMAKVRLGIDDGADGQGPWLCNDCDCLQYMGLCQQGHEPWLINPY